jgi:hypothetical protein
MKSNGVINLILPAVEIVQDHEPTDTLLGALGTSTKEVIELFLNAWAEFKHMDETDILYYGDSEFRAQAMRQSFTVNARLLVMDILFDAWERRIEEGQGPKITEQDRIDAEKVLMSIWSNLAENIFSLLEELKVTDLQISQLKFVKWIGDDFIISFPRYHMARAPDKARNDNDSNSQ